MGGCWRIRPREAFRIRRWEGEETAVLYDPESGETHLLTCEAVRWLERLQGGEVLEAVDREMARLFEQLYHHRLVEPVP